VAAGWQAIHRLVERGVASAADLLLPPSCNACGQALPAGSSQPLLCAACRSAFSAIPSPLCRRCASPTSPTDAGDDCARCRDRHYQFEAASALGVYRDRLRDAVIRMKQLGQEPLTLSVGFLLAAVLRERVCQPRPDLLVPVPAHWWKRLMRGVNGPDLLAEAISQTLAIPLFADLLVCRRRTRKQGTLLPSERLVNVRDAFRVSANYDVAGAEVLLVDDIMTTGATASEAAKTLRRAGAARVRVALVARGTGADQRGPGDIRAASTCGGAVNAKNG
jgi:ComF family protein